MEQMHSLKIQLSGLIWMVTVGEIINLKELFKWMISLRIQPNGLIQMVTVGEITTHTGQPR